MIHRQDIKIKILLIVLFVAALTMILLPAYFSRRISYGCTVQFVDNFNAKVVMRVDAICHDDGVKTNQYTWYTNHAQSFERYSIEIEKNNSLTIKHKLYRSITF